MKHHDLLQCKAMMFIINSFWSQKCQNVTLVLVLPPLSWLPAPGHNMSVLGSQVDVDMDESVPDPVPKHQGHTGTGCYKLHDHEFMRPKHRVTGAKPELDKTAPPTNIMDLPVDSGAPQQAVQQLKHMSSPAHRSPVRNSRFYSSTRYASFNQIFPIILEWYPTNVFLWIN